MTEVTMPRAVGHVTRDTSQADMDAELPEGTLLITTTQAEAYKDACVREALEEAAAVAKKRSAVLPHYPDIVRGYADGRKAAAAEIRALIPQQ